MTLTGSNSVVVGDLCFKPSHFFHSIVLLTYSSFQVPKMGGEYQKIDQICSEIGENAPNGDKNCHFGQKMTKSHNVRGWIPPIIPI